MRRKTYRHIAIFALFFLGACGMVPLTPTGPSETIRALVVKGASSLEVKTSQGGPPIIITASKDPFSVSINGSIKTLPLYFTPEGEFIYIDGRPYRGRLTVIAFKDALGAVNELPIEDYAAGIINNEISSKWHVEAVKAQAVISRTYALYHKKKRPIAAYHVEGTVMGQVYNGAASEDPAARKAVMETYGEALYYNGAPALAVYHSNAGGMTDAAKDVWKSDYPYLISVASAYDELYPRFYWEYSLPAGEFKELLNKAGLNVSEPESVFPKSVTPAGRIKTLSIKDVDYKTITMTGEDLRKILGYGNLRSTIFGGITAGDLKKDSGMFVFKGKGSGHGVGMSQWGAKGMAEKGSSYKKILKHYYPGTELVKIP
ncbi:MAG: SpoIID/LytB domain-containing protein [Deltaproteobacteria bacterium]|nr:SpoIID/LytB domain-containing protein [Deltaproteobacteria bacterium]